VSLLDTVVALRIINSYVVYNVERTQEYCVL